MSIRSSIAERGATIRSVIDCLSTTRKNDVFLVCPSTSKSTSFAELDERCKLLSAQLNNQGLPPQAKIAILMDNSIGTAQLFLALMYSDYVAVPLNCADSAKSWQRVLEDSDCVAIFTSAKYTHQLNQIQNELGNLQLFGYDDADGLTCIDTEGMTRTKANSTQSVPSKNASGCDPRENINPDSDALVAYTSGSTGKPKGALFSHHNLLVGGLNTVVAHDLSEADVSLLVLPLYHMNAQIVTLMSTLISGGKVVVPQSFNVQDFWEHVSTYRCTWFALVPTIISQLVQRAETHNFKHSSVLEHVRFARSSSAPLNTNLHQQFEKIFSMPMLEAMGMTEAGGAIFSNPLPPMVRKLGSPGLPFGFSADLKDAQPSTDSGMVGELLLKGESIMKGYLNQEELTKEILSADGTLTTGDIARLDEDGYIFIVGRTSEVIRKGAEKIPPREIENVLLRHPAVAEAAVIGVPDPHWGNEVLAFITTKTGKSYNENELLEFCRGELGLLKAPRSIIVMNDFPRAAAFKINKRALSAFAPSFANSKRDEHHGISAQSSLSGELMEKKICAIWAEVLHQENIDVDDDFFSLGGTSLLATDIAIRIKKEFGADIGLHGFLEHSSIRKQAGAIARGSHVSDARNAYTAAWSADPEANTAHTEARSADTEAQVKALQTGSAPDLNSKQFPLSSAQERIWLFEQVTPGTAAYNESEAVRLRGTLDLQRFENALRRVISKHHILRTRFATKNGKPTQEVFEDQIPLVVEDISTHPEVLQDRMQSWIQRPFNFETDQLVRLVILRISDDEHVFLFVMHHLICDRASIGTFMREISAAYNFQHEVPASVHQKLATQFGDFALRQKSRLSSDPSKDSQEFWQTRLESIDTVLDLPTTFARQSAEPTYNGSKVTRALRTDVAESIASSSKGHNVSTFELMASALALVVQKYTGQRDFAIAMPIDKRLSSDLLPLIGFFADTHFAAFHLEKDKTVTELVQQTHSEMTLMRKHSDVPLEEALKAMSRTIRNREFIPILLNQRYANDRSDALVLTNINSELITTHNGCAKFPLSVTITYGASECVVDIEYNTDLFDAPAATRFLEHYECALEELTRAHAGLEKLDALRILPDTEYKFVTQGINQTQTDYPKLAVHELFRQQAAESPDAPAVECKDVRLTYKQLDERTDILAKLLLRRKSKENNADYLVGMFLERSEDIVISALAILKAGGAYVPLDSQYPKERLKFMIEDAGINTVVTHLALSKQLMDLELDLDLLAVDAGHAIHTNATTTASRPQNQSENLIHPSSQQISDLAYVTYTSGSTGRPKGVEVPHQGILRLVFGNDYATLDSSERILHHSAVTFDLTTFEIFAPLLHGGCCVVHAERSTDIAKLAQSIAEKRITTMWLTASLYNELIVQFPSYLENLKQLIIGGEALSVHHTVLGLETLFNTALVNGYGPTENTTLTTCYKIPRDFSKSASSVPIGKGLNHTTVFVLDENLRPVPIGIPGELYTGGDGLARGYRNRPDLTAERFITSPFDTSARIYKTGDRARVLSDGNIEYLGRLDDQVKLRGFRIEPGEIDRVLNQHPSVKNSVTVVQDDTPTGRALVSYFTGSEGSDFERQLRAHVKNYVPSYMVPSYFIRLNELPVNPSGKVDKARLPRPSSNGSTTEQFDSPETATEEIVAGIMAEALGRQQLSTTDDFFDNGGHSLMALQFVDNISATFKTKIPVATLFDYPTPCLLAAHIAAVLSKETDSGDPTHATNQHSLIPIKPGGSRSPIFFTPGGDGTESAFLVYAKLARHLKDTPFYGLRARGVAYGIEPHLTVEAMARDYLVEVRRHQPRGPYIFAGECVGGVIAYEMARQAKEQGEQIELLLLLDCRPPTAAQFAGKRIKWAWSRMSAIASKTLLGTESKTRTVPNSETQTGSESETRRDPESETRIDFESKTRRDTETETRMDPESKTRIDPGSETRTNFESQPRSSNSLSLKDLMWLSYQKTLLRYRPKEYSGDMVLILNEEYSKLNLTESWQKFVRGTVRTVAVSGDHTSYIREHATETASRINDLLGCALNAP